MPHVNIPLDLLQAIEAALPVAGTADQFVQQAVREKLAHREQSNELVQLARKNREAMLQQGLSEEEVLADFESWRTNKDS